MKALLIFGLTLVAFAYVSQKEGRLGRHENVRWLTDTLTQPIKIFTGKHKHYTLSLSYERCRFNIGRNVFSVIAANMSSRQELEALTTGDTITVWFDAEDEPSTHSYLHTVNAVGIGIGDKVIVDPKVVAGKNQVEYYWTMYIGAGLMLLSIIMFVYRKLK
jgi:hypothetical protein